jgi:ADP-dependent NAD(P)H-hydrate dehydratase
MSRRADPTAVDERMLRAWPLPAPGGSKDARGRVVVIGGSEHSPGGLLLAGVAALRVGAGRLTLVTPGSVALQMAIAVPEAGVLALPEGGADATADPLGDELRSELAGADAVLVGPGLDDLDLTRRLVEAVCRADGVPAAFALDAFALGVLPGLEVVLPSRAVLSPNVEEAALLLGDGDGEPAKGDADVDGALDGDAQRLDAVVARIAERYRAAVSCYGAVADPDGAWRVRDGGPGLGTSGSGDVLAGAITGLLARGADAAQAAVWATHLHALAGKRLAEHVGEVGFLARELCEELPRALAATG